MKGLRQLAYAAVTVAFLHIVFGAVVRISGSGMGCGDHWPKCYGYWFPPFSRPDLVIEVLHRYFAATLTAVVVGLFALATRRRSVPGVGGPSGVLRASALAAALVVLAAGFGAVTVRFANAPWATVAHKGIAAALLAVLAAALVRAGGLGAHRARTLSASAKTARGTLVAAGLALTAVLLGGLTAKIPGAAVACTGFPFCGADSLGGPAQHVQLTHRVVAYLLALHLLGLVVALGRRGERGPAATAVRAAGAVVLLQLALGASMVLFAFPPVLRSLHQATGIALWLTTFVAAYLARRGLAGPAPVPLRDRPAPPRESPGTPAVGVANRTAPTTTIALFERPLPQATEEPRGTALRLPRPRPIAASSGPRRHARVTLDASHRSTPAVAADDAQLVDALRSAAQAGPDRAAVLAPSLADLASAAPAANAAANVAAVRSGRPYVTPRLVARGARP